MTTINELAKIVADDFKATMDEFGFETFNEMAKCYWWTSADIKEEVSAIVDEVARERNELLYVSDDGEDVFAGCEDVSYRTFAKMFRKEICK